MLKELLERISERQVIFLPDAELGIINIDELEGNDKVKLYEGLDHIERIFDVEDNKLVQHVYKRINYELSIEVYSAGLYEYKIGLDEYGSDEEYRHHINNWVFIDEKSRDAFYESNKGKFPSKYAFEKSTMTKSFYFDVVKYLGANDFEGYEDGYNDSGYWKIELEKRHTIIE